MSTPDLQVRQDNETPQAYAAYVLYRDLGAGRSVDKAYRAAQEAKGQQTGSKRAAGRWFLWCVEHDWTRRADSWEASLHLSAQEERQSTFRAQVAAFQAQQVDAARIQSQAALTLAEKALERLQKVDPDQVELKDLPAFLRASAVVAQAAADATAITLGLEEILRTLPMDVEARCRE